MNDPAVLALLASALTLGLREGIAWLRNRRKEEAEAGLTVDQRWENWANTQDERILKLEDRVKDLEEDLERERQQKKALAGEVDRYKSIARSLLRHVIRLREALGQSGAEVPEMPPEVEDALTIINLPN